jgi:hypothetical protein
MFEFNYHKHAYKLRNLIRKAGIQEMRWEKNLSLLLLEESLGKENGRKENNRCMLILSVEIGEME